ncbi:stage II sporulation E family protein [Mycobacterium xenopi 4042]|uniref:Stage II sporulation E family protein n=1 Tax=Mycobacterium xenopi 4042 TaxID=1299334 RepID=X8AGJ7_MYCXE|nr:stage II sporulation E family protein [Mycobacterium xenopi 4042]
MLRYSSAGHMPALFATPDAGQRCWPRPVGAAGGAPRSPRPQASQALPPGSTLIVFTDGLVERKHEPIDAGIARVAKVLTDNMDLPVDHLADAVVRELARQPDTTTTSPWWCTGAPRRRCDSKPVPPQRSWPACGIGSRRGLSRAPSQGR